MEKIVKHKTETGAGDDISIMGGISQIKKIYGLVHPNTDWFDSHEELVSRWRDYSGLIKQVSEDKSSVLVFVGTATSDTLDKLRHLDEGVARRLSVELPKLNDQQRNELKQTLKDRGIHIKDNARYSFLEELSLIHGAVISIEPDRLLYFESSIDEKVIGDRLGDKINNRTIGIYFRGEKPDVCVDDQGKKLCEALGIEKERLRISWD